MEETGIGNNQQASNLMSFNTEQLEQLLSGDKADKISYSAGQTNGRFDVYIDSVHSTVEEGETFSSAGSDSMEVPKNLKPRQRRVSDVIDSIGDCWPDMNVPKMVSSPDKFTGTQGPDSPMSSGYGSVDSGTPKSTVSPDSHTNVTPKKFLTVPRVDVTDAALSAADASPMNQDEDMPPR
jgi:hypothetical protein